MMIAVHSNVSEVTLMSNIFRCTAEKKAVKSGLVIVADWNECLVWKGFSSLEVVVVDPMRNCVLASLPEKTKRERLQQMQPCALSPHRPCCNDAAVCKHRLGFLNAISSNYVAIKISKVILLKCARGMKCHVIIVILNC